MDAEAEATYYRPSLTATVSGHNSRLVKFNTSNDTQVASQFPYLAYREWGIHVKGMGIRFSAKQLTTAEEVIKRKIKAVKGAKVYLRVFPGILVCINLNLKVHLAELDSTFTKSVRRL
ncbi:uncharacterized protein EDB91DRAFT_1083706 [Suillus paluster]|uniref:uncharacterized protein n=1 Tax=Suillus paluster TaxID=48578 RepID=UPI001B87E700|nr:uncharacterized protein EDB91DRAFT_1083706 [Suillus paluster]KAG1735629.1 hypothetical protein EDB91DRAFT_1083706 [Suillus paluster]